jgi:O-antigen/teichoic acid export membrane protein
MLKSSFGNSAWAVLEHVFYPLLVFATTPFFFHAIGAEQYGFWMLLVATTSFGTILNVGTGAAVIKYVSADIGKGGVGGITSTLRGSLAVALLGGCFFASVILLVYWLVGEVLFAKMGNPWLLRLTGIAAALLAWIEQLDNVYASTLKGAERFGNAARVEMAGRTVQIAAAIFSVVTSGTVEALYAALIIASIVRLWLKIHLVRKSMAIAVLRPSWSAAMKILHFSKWGWLQGIGAILFGVADRLFVGSFLGATHLAHYSIASQLASQVHAVAAAGISVTFPFVSRSRETDPSFSLRATTWLTFVETLIVSSGLAVLLLLFGKEILNLWVGSPEAEAAVGVLRYLAVAYWILAMNVAPHFLLLGLGRVRFVALSNLIAGLVSLPIMWQLIQAWNLEGVAVARGIYGVLTCVSFVPLLRVFWGERHDVRR